MKGTGEFHSCLTEEKQIYHTAIKLNFSYSVYAEIQKIG